MFEPPQTHYAKSGEVHIAYQTVGDGPRDVVLMPDWVSHIEAFWDHSTFERPLRRMGARNRLILFDKRGVGLSDPVPVEQILNVETWMDDLLTVLDACESRQAVLAGTGHGGQMALLFAATHPERIEALLLTNCYARLGRAPDYPWGVPAEVQDKVVLSLGETWGSLDSPAIDLIAPSVAGDEEVRRWWARMERLACSPGVAVTMQRAMYAYDVRHVLPAVKQPTLVMHTTGNRHVRVGHGRYLAERIPGAVLREFDSDNHWWFLGQHSEEMWNVAMEFIAGTPGDPDTDRVLATVLFTDVVNSTEQAALLGDATWTRLLDDLDAVVGRQMARFQGKLIKSLGDGHLATFDGPGRAIRCGRAISEAVRSLGLEVRCGLHTGEIELRGDDVGGVALHIAARVMALAGPNEVLVSGSVPPLVVGSGFDFDDRGEHNLKGVPGKWSVFAVKQ